MATIGVLKEVKNGEKRVGLDPDSVKELVDAGHSVIVQRNAGTGCGWTDSMYEQAGATVRSYPDTIVQSSDIVVKVKEPVKEEFYWLKLMKDKTLFTFLHLADNPELAKELLDNKVVGLSYDTVEDSDGRLPLLKPMSVIAGRYAGRFFGEDIEQGKIKRALILGGGTAGQSAARTLIDEFNIPDVVIYEKNREFAEHLRDVVFYDDPVDVFSCDFKVPAHAYKSDLIIGCVLEKAKKAPKVISEACFNNLRHGTKLVDIAIDQGGCMHGSRPTTHDNPTYEIDGKTFCCVPNMPGAYPVEAVKELVKESLPILKAMLPGTPENDALSTEDGDGWISVGGRGSVGGKALSFSKYFLAINTMDGKVFNLTVKSELEKNSEKLSNIDGTEHSIL